jgi:hypothetical protein
MHALLSHVAMHAQVLLSLIRWDDGFAEFCK